MLIKMINADRIKINRSPIWLVFLLIPMVSALLGTINYSANIEILTKEWYSLWTQHTLFTCYIFLPVMLGIYCSYLMRLENNNHNWNKVLTMPVPVYQVFLSKLIIGSAMLFLTEVWIGILFVVSGKIVGLTSAIPTELILWLIGGTLGGMVIISIQLLLSLAIKSFAVPIGIALAGGLSGLAALAKGYGHIYPYSLMSYGMRSNAPQQLMENGNIPFVLTCIGFIVLFSIIGGIWLSKRDVKS